jgi:TRAP transporter 4TM/12TM fusion protein
MEKVEHIEGEENNGPQRELTKFWSLIVIALTIFGILFAVNKVFRLDMLGILQYSNSYIYALCASLLSIIFVLYPGSNKLSSKKLPWYDIVLFALMIGIPGYFALIGYDILSQGWDFTPPMYIAVLAIIFALLILEALRRVGGTVLFIVAAIFMVYPMFAGYMPGLLKGVPLTFMDVMSYHSLGTSSILGIASSIFGDMLIGFILFGAVLVGTGAGKFFLDFALSLFGTQRGGIAKVAVISSSLFGTISGSGVSNILTTGSMTIPAMKKAGFPAQKAGAIEAVSSIGGNITPPIMGSTAFLMAAWLGIPYSEVILATIIPIILYYVAIYVQVDAMAVKLNLKGEKQSNLPSVKESLIYGWPYLVSMIVLIYFIFAGYEARGPFIASLVLIILALIRKQVSLGKKETIKLLLEIGRLLSLVFGLMAGVGLIIGAFGVTGIGAAFSSEMVRLADGNVYLLLVLGALTSIILGMGMTTAAVYIFLAVILAPALVSVGLNEVAIHLFIIYFAVVSYITPPVAIGSYTASSIANASPWKTSIESVKLGIVAYLVPFFFVFRPEMIMQTDSMVDVIYPFITSIIGVYFLAGAMQGYIVGLGSINKYFRLLFGLGGLLLFVPDTATDIIGFILLSILVGIILITKKSKSVNTIGQDFDITNK